MMESPAQRVTLRMLRRRAEAGEKFPLLTCYDATMARWLQRGGIDALLVGDTAAEMVLGHDSTIHATMDFMVQITAGVRRGAPLGFVMADMPFMSYQADTAEALHNAGRFLTEGGADVVKVEVEAADAELVERLARAGVPVVAHLGARPQQVRRTGGYRASGRSAAEGQQLVETAETMEARGAVMLLLEATTAEVSERIVQRTSVPVIGCGAGPACHGHVVVVHDLLGLTDWQPPFARPQTALGDRIAEAAAHWAEQVRTGRYLRDDHPYRMSELERQRWAGR